jgi:hypothetical protein
MVNSSNTRKLVTVDNTRQPKRVFFSIQEQLGIERDGPLKKEALWKS